MERTMTPEERIKRAEEIYNRRNYRNNYSTHRVREEKIDSQTGKKKLIKKMLVQIGICTLIYAFIFLISNSNQILSKDIINKAKEILSYDISLNNLKNIGLEYLKKLNLNISDESKNEENTQTTNTDVNEEIKNIETTSNIEINTNVIQNGVGGTDEPPQTVEEKSQEDLDVEYIKQNYSIMWPLNGIITSSFGPRTPTDIVSANHCGLDIAGNIGDSIVAAMDGTVTLVSSEGDYGNHIKIENGDITTLYAHCSTLLVVEGTEVKQGNKIAEVGETGRATRTTSSF